VQSDTSSIKSYVLLLPLTRAVHGHTHVAFHVASGADGRGKCLEINGSRLQHERIRDEQSCFINPL